MVETDEYKILFGENWTVANSRTKWKIGLNLSINCWSAREVFNFVP
jgi:hypothetical protein